MDVNSNLMLKRVNKLKNYKHCYVYDFSLANLIIGSELVYECIATNFNWCLSHGISTLKIKKSIKIRMPKKTINP